MLNIRIWICKSPLFFYSATENCNIKLKFPLKVSTPQMGQTHSFLAPKKKKEKKGICNIKESDLIVYN